MLGIEIINTEKGYYELGVELGRILKSSSEKMNQLRYVMDNYKMNQQIDEIQFMLEQYCPMLIQEILGIKDSLGWSEEDAFRLFAGYGMPAFEMGCTSFATKDYYVRNYDFSPEMFDGMFIQQNSNLTSGVRGNSQFLVGRLDGMNRHGLVAGLHFVNNEQYEKGFLCSSIVRIVLEMCTDVEEAIHVLKEIPHAASYNYSLLDQKGQLAIVEASPGAVAVVKNQMLLSCVNSFQTEEMLSYNRLNQNSSFQRLRALQPIDENMAEKHVHEWFSNPCSPVFFTDYDHFFGTLYTISFVPVEQKIYLTPANGRRIEL